MKKASIFNECSIKELDFLNKEFGLEFPVNNGIIEAEDISAE